MYDLKLPDLIRLKSFKEAENTITLDLAPLGFRGPPKEHNEVYNCLKDVLTGLKGVHEQGWVHRDVKLANVILCLDGTWHLIDLDLAVKMNEQVKLHDHFGIMEIPHADCQDNENWQPKHDVQQVVIMLQSLKLLFWDKGAGEN